MQSGYHKQRPASKSDTGLPLRLPFSLESHPMVESVGKGRRDKKEVQCAEGERLFLLWAHHSDVILSQPVLKFSPWRQNLLLLWICSRKIFLKPSHQATWNDTSSYEVKFLLLFWFSKHAFFFLFMNQYLWIILMYRHIYSVSLWKHWLESFLPSDFCVF